MKIFTTIFGIIALFVFALVFGAGTSPPVAEANAALSVTQKVFTHTSAPVAGVEQAIQNQIIETYPTDTLRAATPARSRFDFKIVSHRTPETNLTQFDKPPSVNTNAVIETPNVLRL